jgi:hypothetical protein
VCAEIGVLEGDFSELILNYLNPTTFYLIDPYLTGTEEYNKGLKNHKIVYSNEMQHTRILRRFSSHIKTGTVNVDRRFSYKAVNNYSSHIFNFIYHDASHLYKDLKIDLETWFCKLKPDGLMCGHDYIEHESFGVIQAVDEFCEEYELEMIVFNEAGGDYALKRIQ